jgi:D-methionine transport system substrate-binding protein
MTTSRFLLAGLAALALTACNGQPAKPDASDALSIAATAVPHAEILDLIAPTLARQGVKLDVRVFNDYVQPNVQVAEGRIAVSYFETKPYLDEFNRSRGTKLVPIAGIHVEPLGAYSRKWKTIGEVPAGATIAIPSEGSNSGRALLLLDRNGLITLKKPASPTATPRDIVANPKGFKFRELEAPTLPRVLDQLDLALINTNYALDAGLNPTRDALLIEDKNSPYVNYVVGPESAKNDPRVQKLVAALRSPEVRAFIERKYGGAVLPAF